MKHLNPELERLEQRIAPDLIDLGISVGVGIGINNSTGTGSGNSGTNDSTQTG